MLAARRAVQEQEVAVEAIVGVGVGSTGRELVEGRIAADSKVTATQ